MTDENSEESHKQIMLEDMKAVDALTINDEYKVRRQITNYEDKLKDAPKLEKLQEQLTSRKLQDSIKKTVEKKQREKELQAQNIEKMRQK